MTVIDERQLSAFVTAFEKAWDELVASGHPISPQMLLFREILARHILAMAGDCAGASISAPPGRYRPSTVARPEGRVVNALA
ncbi:MAG: hypothetical protein IT537_19000 [Hyphomicrobiales bacterium]|nr:hypothetical protein [Hyphomicrobiales bacterium]